MFFICPPCVVQLRAVQSASHSVVLANTHTYTPIIHTYSRYTHHSHTHSLHTDPDRTRPGYTLITCLELDIISASRLTMETRMEGQVRGVCSRVCDFYMRCMFMNVFLCTYVSRSRDQEVEVDCYLKINCPDIHHLLTGESAASFLHHYLQERVHQQCFNDANFQRCKVFSPVFCRVQCCVVVSTISMKRGVSVWNGCNRKIWKGFRRHLFNPTMNKTLRFKHNFKARVVFFILETWCTREIVAELLLRSE